MNLQCETPCLQSLFLYKIYKVGSCRRRRRRRRKIVIKKAWNYTLAKCSTPFSFRPDFHYLSAVVSFLMKKHIDFVFHCFRCRGGSNKFNLCDIRFHQQLWMIILIMLLKPFWGQQITPLFGATYLLFYFWAKELLSLVRSTPLQQIYTYSTQVHYSSL